MTSFARQSTPPPGAIFRRCACKSPAGKQLGKRCPQLSEDLNHGTWTYRIVIPADHDGFRRGMKRGGHASEEAAIQAWREMNHAVRSGIARSRTATWRSRDYLIAASAMLAEDMRLLDLTGSSAGTVYAILAPPYVKIGHSQDVHARLTYMKNKGHAALKAPDDLDFDGCRPWRGVAGSREDERAVQHLARNYWVTGEWFWADPALLNALRSVLTTGLQAIKHTPRKKAPVGETGTATDPRSQQ